METQICNKCSEDLPLDKFHKCKDKLSGYRSTCKACRKVSETLPYYQKNKEKIKSSHKENPNTLVYNRSYYLNNQEYFEEYRKVNSDHYKQWRIDNREKINAYHKYKKATDINYKLKSNLRSRLSGIISRSKYQKANSTMSLLGCSIEDFKKHIEKNFTENMSWDNYGLWHLDHIKACANFDLSDPLQQEECFHYTNFQPLWAKDNLKKSKY